MHIHEFDAILEKTFDDRRLSRGERKALKALLTERVLDTRELALYRQRAFAKARESLGHTERSVLDWLEEVIKALQPEALSGDARTRATTSQAYFSPGNQCSRRIIALLMGARTSVDICVFTITDDRISDAIADAHRRGVSVRIITDDDKALDRGSDVTRLAEGGIEVVVDQSPSHMHHKFALFDRARLLTGSYNWTRSAELNNQENLIVTDEPALVSAFASEFDRLWKALG